LKIQGYRELTNQYVNVVQTSHHIAGMIEEGWLNRLTIGEARGYGKSSEFGKGSMQPEVDAVLDFLEKNPAANGLTTSLEALKEVLAGNTGTWIRGS